LEIAARAYTSGPVENKRLPGGLYALCDDSVRRELPLALKAAQLLAGGVGVLQLRMKHTPLPQALEAAREVAALCRAAGARCLVNDRVELVLLSGADGVHLGDEDLPCAAARQLLGPGRLIGVTARSAAAIAEAHAGGADYVGLGPVFASTTKASTVPALGLGGLRALAASSPLPVVAISGITLDNIAQVAATGVACAAVASDVLNAPDIAARARLLARAFDSGAGPSSVRGTS
jgi:thiamine-phosphate pyrophosphorylase